MAIALVLFGRTKTPSVCAKNSVNRRNPVNAVADGLKRWWQKMAIKPNCRRCFYGGSFSPKAKLASCECENVTEPTIIKHDPLFDKDRRYVSRGSWSEECNCGQFIPHLSESEGDYELEAVYTFNTEFDCPFCGSAVYVWNIGIEETKLITCDECGKQIAVEGKGI